MKESTKAILMNVVIILLLLGANYITTSPNDYHVLGRFAFAGIFILLTGFINILMGIAKLVRRNEGGEFFILIGGIILLIGFSVCTKLA